jgi:hypothetical protein
MISKKYYQVISILIIVAAVYYSFYSLTPSESVEKTSKLTEFSTDLALNHLKEITKKPHFPGTLEHEKVREYIVSEFEKLGLQVEIQEQIAINEKWRAGTNTKNILVRIKGVESGKALLLLSHYDSNPHSSLGASDAGSGVVVILEGIRAFLANNQQVKNDIVICISDAEELGLLGANAFVNNHPWSKDIGLVLNFEARGSGGPSYMLMETNGGNKNLIQSFDKANTQFPVGNSLMYSIYKMLPNDTDLTVFREDGDIDGFNFAFIGDHFDYHTAQDSYERMDIKSLKHQASYLMDLLNYFSNADITNLKANEDYVYFNFPYVGMIYYPFSWVLLMFLFSLIVFLALTIIGLIKKKISLFGILKGFIPFLLSLIFTSLLSFYGWKLLLKIHPQYNDILHGFTYNGYYYIIAFIAISIGILFWFYKGFLKKRTAQDLLVAPLFIWLIINGFIAFYLKGAAFFILPVFIMLIMLGLLLFSKFKHQLFFTVLSIPVLIVFSPLLKIFPVGLGLKMLIISSVFCVLLFGFLIPVIKQYGNHKKLANLFIFVGVLALVTATMYSSYSEDRKKPNSILYVLDVNEESAYWASYDTKVDGFTKQFLGENPIEGSYDKNITASKYNTKIKLHSKTSVKNIEKPIISVISDTIIGEERKVCLNIHSVRNANKIEILSMIPISFKSFKINNESIKKIPGTDYLLSTKGGTIMNYFLTEDDENIDFEFVVSQHQKFDLDILEAKYDLFSNSEFEIEPRSEVMMPMPFVLNDATIIKTNFKF